MGRRGFLKLMGASIALAGATACTRQPDELIVPYVRQPEDVIPGKPLFFATAMTLGGIGDRRCWPRATWGGRPSSKAIPIIPSSVGATDLFGQATILTMYDPDRAQSVIVSRRDPPWGGFVQAMRSQLAELTADGGAGLRFLSETIGSPTLAAQIQRAAAGAAAGEVAPVRAGVARERVCRGRARLRSAGRRALPLRSGAT